MPRPLRKPAALANRVFHRAAAGDLSAAQLRTAAWRRVQRGTYADADIALTHGLRCHAAKLLIPGSAAIGGRSAAWLYGVELLDTADPVEIVVPPGDRFGRVSGLRVHRTNLPEADVVRVGEHVPVTTAARTAWDIARFYDVVESVPYLDAMLAARLISLKDLQARLAACTVRWGRTRLATALDLADRRAESPQESRVRVQLIRAGLPRPECQYQVFDGHRFVARVDLAWPERKVAVEYDGVWHADAAQFHRDRRRLNKLIAAGWTVVHITSVRLHDDFDAIVRQIRAALGIVTETDLRGKRGHRRPV